MNLANMNVRNSQAFVGRSAFAHKGGDARARGHRLASSYEHIAPETVGTEQRVLVSELAGRSNIIAKATKYALEKDDKLMRRSWPRLSTWRIRDISSRRLRPRSTC